MIIYKIKDIPSSIYDMIGGKARGLRELIEAKLNVPEGFIVADINRDEDYSFTLDYYSKSGLKGVVVRSSVPGDAGEVFSAVSHRAITLNINDKHKLLTAIKKSTESLKNYMQTDYCKHFDGGKRMGVSLVIQSMIDVKYSGVCFSKNPLTGKSEIVIEAIRGISADRLYSKSKSRRYTIAYKAGEGMEIDTDTEFEYVGEGGKLLTSQQLEALCIDLVKAVKHFGAPLNMEWVIDKEGKIYWLEVKRITTLDFVSLEEFDGYIGDDTTIFTRLGMLDVLPSMATPLTHSTTVAYLDAAMRIELMRAGIPRGMRHQPNSCLASFSSHLFLNATAFRSMNKSLIKTDLECLEKSIFGESLNASLNSNAVQSNTQVANVKQENINKDKKQNVLLRFRNSLSYVLYFLSYKRSVRRIEALNSQVKIKEATDPSELYSSITSQLDILKQSANNYYVAYVHSRIMNCLLANAIKESGNRIEDILPSLLEGYEGHEKVDIVGAMRRVATEAIRQYPAAADFHVAKLSEIIKDDEKEIKNAYNSLLANYGHRCADEAELRSRSWRVEQQPLIENILSLIKQSGEEGDEARLDLDTATKKLLKKRKFIKKRLLRYIIQQARQGEYAREYTKSQFVSIIDAFKTAYDKLAQTMKSKHIICDKDLIYFLTHGELGRLLSGGEQILIKHAMQRKKQFEYRATLKFDNVCISKPLPTNAVLDASCVRCELNGSAVSYGDARGYARVVNRVEELCNVKEGEILVVQCTDIRWTDYFSVISGLIAETGTMLSDDSILAREFGLPLVIGVENATKLIKTGDYISLNARQGTISILA